MEYDIKKYTTPETAWKRITKYIERGFNLTGFCFDDDKVVSIGQNCFAPLINGLSFNVCMIDDNDTTSNDGNNDHEIDRNDPDYRVESI